MLYTYRDQVELVDIDQLNPYKVPGIDSITMKILLELQGKLSLEHKSRSRVEHWALFFCLAPALFVKVHSNSFIGILLISISININLSIFGVS